MLPPGSRNWLLIYPLLGLLDLILDFNHGWKSEQIWNTPPPSTQARQLDANTPAHFLKHFGKVLMANYMLQKQ
jgi:hypothetical protein